MEEQKRILSNMDLRISSTSSRKGGLTRASSVASMGQSSSTAVVLTYKENSDMLGTFRIRDAASPTLQSLKRTALTYHKVHLVLEGEDAPTLSPGKSLCKLVYSIQSLGMDLRIKSDKDISDAVALGIKKGETLQLKLIPVPPHRTRRSITESEELKLQSVGEENEN